MFSRIIKCSIFLLVFCQVSLPALACVDPDEQINKLLSNRRYADAEALALSMVEQEPDDPKRYFDLAVVYGARAFIEDTAPERRKEIELSTQDKKSLTDFNRYFRKTSYDEIYFDLAIKNHRKVIKRWPGHKQAWLCLVDLYQGSGQDKEMYKVIDEIMALYSGNKKDFILNLIPFADTMTKNHEMERASSYFRHLIKHFPKDSMLLTSYAYLKLTNGELEEAIEYYKRAHEVDTRDPVALQNLGLAYILLQDFDKSRAVFEKAIANDPTNTPMYFQIGILSLSGSDIEAKAAWSQFFEQHKKHPDNPQWVQVAMGVSQYLDEGFNDDRRFGLAESFIRRGLNQYGIPVLVPLLARNPDNHIYALTLAEAYENSKLPRKAYEYGKMAVSIVEAKPDKHDNVVRAGLNYETGRIANNLGYYEESLEYLRKAVELNPEQGNIQYMVGRTYSQLGNDKEALKWFRDCKDRQNNLRFMTECERLVTEISASSSK